jgi:hypothetical protein
VEGSQGRGCAVIRYVIPSCIHSIEAVPDTSAIQNEPVSVPFETE